MTKPKRGLLFRKGLKCLSNKQYELSKKFFWKSCKESRKVKDTSLEGECLENLGIIYLRLDQDASKASYCFSLAVSLFRFDKNKLAEGNCLMYLAEAYRVLGQFFISLELYEQAIFLFA